jgi:hypothetical protein
MDLVVAAGRDPIADASGRSEMRVLVWPGAVLSPPGFRRHSRVRRDQLSQLIPRGQLVRGQLVVVPTGHGPWLGRPPPRPPQRSARAGWTTSWRGADHAARPSAANLSGVSAERRYAALLRGMRCRNATTVRPLRGLWLISVPIYLDRDYEYQTSTHCPSK